MKSIARRVSDGRMLGLIKAWLEMPVEEDDGKGGKRRTNRARRERKGTPQGPPMTPQTQKITFAIGVASSVRFRRTRAAFGRVRDRNGMANGDHILADLHLIHEEPDNTLPVGDVRGFGGQAQPIQESPSGFRPA